MEAEIYVDLYFLINTSMDFLCLLITGRLLHARMGTGRLLLAAAAGGGYAILSLLLSVGGVIGFFMDCAAALLSSAVAFASRGIRLRRIFLLLFVLWQSCFQAANRSPARGSQRSLSCLHNAALQESP